ncbi:MAG: alpha/beta fold hydrolase [Ktedonobacteraceae bacterium]|nr:alpha/beta fold hydrolase [Ktedonobacteraceae bacterium]
MSTPIMQGAEPISITDGTRGGVLLLHGYTATVQQVRDWALAFAQAGYAVEAPLLPGHGTSVDEMVSTTWSDYMRSADESYRKLAARHQHILVGGLCLGGNIAASLAMKYPTETAGLIVINSPFKSPGNGNPEVWKQILGTGKQFFTWSTAPKFVEDPQAPAVLSYNKVPIAPMTSLYDALTEQRQRLNEIRCPVLVFTSLHDTSNSSNDSRPWLEEVSGPAEQLVLENSNHVATFDYDKVLLEARSIEFAHAVVG